MERGVPEYLAESVTVAQLRRAYLAEALQGCDSKVQPYPVALEPRCGAFRLEDFLRVPWRLSSPQPASGRPYAQWLRLHFPRTETYDPKRAYQVMRAWAGLRGPIALDLLGCEGLVEVYVSQTGPGGRLAQTLRDLLHVEPEPLQEDPLAAVREAREVGFWDACARAPYWRELHLDDQGALAWWTQVHAFLAAGDSPRVLQLLLSPAKQDWHTHLLHLIEAERRSQIEGLRVTPFTPPVRDFAALAKAKADPAAPLFFAALRCAATAGDQQGLRKALRHARALLRMLRFGGSSLRLLSHKSYRCVCADPRRVVTERLVHRSGVPLTATEAAGLLCLPPSGALDRGQVRLLGMPVPEPLRRVGMEIGQATYAGRSIPVVLPDQARAKHTYVLGTTGAGKSTFLAGLALGDIARGRGLVVVDLHGELATDLLDRIPPEQEERVRYLDPSLGAVPLFNPLARAGGEASTLADWLAFAFCETQERVGPRMKDLYQQCFYALLRTPGSCLADAADLLAGTARGEPLRARVCAHVADNPRASQFWGEEYPKLSEAKLEPARNRLSQFLLHERVQALFSQTENRFDLDALLREGGVLIASFPVGKLGGESATTLASFLVALLLGAAMRRPPGSPPFVLIADEFQRIKARWDILFSEARKFGLQAVVASQQRGQLDEAAQLALGNAACTVAFRLAERDAKALAGLLSPATWQDLVALAVGEAVVRCEGAVAQAQTPPLPPVTAGTRERIVAASLAACYALRPKAPRKAEPARRRFERLRP